MLDRLKDCTSINVFGNYIVAFGKKLRVFSNSGEYIFTADTIRNPYKAELVSDELLLVEGTAVYHLISLCDGHEIWQSRKPKKTPSRKFAVSDDGDFAYEVLNGIRGFSIMKIDLTYGKTLEFPIRGGLHSISDIICDSDGVPCTLECQHDLVDEQAGNRYGVRKHYLKDHFLRVSNEWMYEWSATTPNQSANAFFNDLNRILTKDYYICDLRNDTFTDILQNEQSYPFSRRMSGFMSWNKQDARYIIDRQTTSNVVIDTQECRIAAIYSAEHHQGCVVGDEFWIGNSEGICRKPFPSFERIQAEKNIFF